MCSSMGSGGAGGSGGITRVTNAIDDSIKASKTIKQGREALSEGLIVINKAEEKQIITASTAETARAHIRNTFDEKFKSRRSTGKGRSEHDVTSLTYKNAQRALQKRVDSWFGRR